MLDIDDQLARLRERISVVNARFANRPPQPVAPPLEEDEPSARSFIEEWSEGQVVTNEFGQHFQTERLFVGRKQHGSADIGALAELPETLLDALGENEIPPASPRRWAFLDTETTGLSGGSGIYAFLIGVGRITPDGFRVRQFFMREYAEERSVLAALESHLSEFDVLITYNGKSYDQPLLETRYRMTRHKPPFARLGHLDLLHGARRLWKLRLESCRLVQLEQEILGFYREGDLPGELIPYVYFEYLRSREAHRLVPIFHHNAMDILTLACLTAIVPAAFRSTDSDSLSRVGVRHGEDLAGIARWLLAAGEHGQSLALFKRAVDAGLPDRLLFRSLWEIAVLEKKLQRPHAAIPVFTELAGCHNEFRVLALEELAKYYEHDERNPVIALEFTNQALAFGESDTLARRKQRLEKRLSKPRPRRLL
ncbi:MAG: ribonuclease H-like domain-containing protein [Acidobacteriaceae bacterium]|nr:ribonuclease H-like domain-containing protein [Acidobacteriaceae bacterium]MBV9502997.1 ribonuclease H-like domain-containing protein [Acidobacteriaceae bacterium]